MESIWSQSCKIAKRDSLHQDIQTEVAVIGAGMAGILTASALQNAGCKVVILEANRIASGQTRNTTAKITSQHGLIYRKLIDTLGLEKAKQYAAANEAAIREYRRIISSAGIDCDLEDKCAYLYGNNEDQLRSEADAAAMVGLPAEFVTDVPLPFSVAGAEKFSNQAQFNPLKFIKALSEPLTIYENTPVKTVDDNLVITDSGKVEAEYIVFDTHYPFINFPGLYFARLHQERSYVIALKNASQVDGMFIGADDPSYSFRNYKDILLLGGGSHRTGENSAGGQYDKLRQVAKKLFPDYEEVTYWSAQDCMTPDGVPYIGHYAKSKPNWYVATGFQKWGMSSSMVSAMIISDMIRGKENPYADVFSPGRFDTDTIPGILREGGQAVKGLSRQFFMIPKEKASHIPEGHGGIVVLNDKKVGVYKDENGKTFAVDVRCPHLGCEVEWNPDEKSWDCPCHGSRFNYLGKLISGPAQEDLDHK